MTKNNEGDDTRQDHQEIALAEAEKLALVAMRSGEFEETLNAISRTIAHMRSKKEDALNRDDDDDE